MGTHLRVLCKSYLMNTNMTGFIVDSQFAMVHTVTTAIIDEYPEVFQKRTIWVLLGTCLSMFLLGMPLVTQVI